MSDILGDELLSESDPSIAKVQLRKSLTTSLRTTDGKPFILVQDQLRSQFFRLGIEDWRIVRLFDGRRTLRQVIKDGTLRYGEENVNAGEVSRLAHWLVQSGLADCVEGSLKMPQAAQSQPAATNWQEPLQLTAQLGRWNPLFLTIELPNPESLLKFAYPYMAWMFSKLFFVVWCVVCGWGVWSVLSDWTRFGSSLQDVFATENWIYLLLVWIVLKVLHELGHAVACMKLGGTVTRCGLMFILFSPIAWVDVTSSWSFRSKWERILVSAAGMYIEFFMAGVAAIIWAKTNDPAIATLSRNIVISASLTTVLFNINFLMRFDGYFILSDLLGIQNMYAAGQQYMQYLGRRYVMGIPAMRPKLSGAKLWLVGCYGWGITIWRIVFCFGIVIVAAHMFRGAGIILAGISAVTWFALPAVRFCLTMWQGHGQAQPDRVRFGMLCGISVLLVTLALVMPWPGTTRAHGVVEYSPLQALRVDSPGFVEVIHVLPGQAVEAGQPLVQLENRDLIRKLADIDLQLASEQIRLRVLHREDEMAQYIAAEKKVETLQEQRAQLVNKVDALTIRAPIAGRVIVDHLDSLEGAYVESGRELLAVGSTGKKEIRVSIQQNDMESFQRMTAKPVSVAIRGHRLPTSRATLWRVNPRATRHILHPALAATAGGPLAVQQNTQSETAESVLVNPHFEGIVSVPAQLSSKLHAGELAQVSLGRGHEKVYTKLWSFARAYFQRKAGGA